MAWLRAHVTRLWVHVAWLWVHVAQLWVHVARLWVHVAWLSPLYSSYYSLIALLFPTTATHHDESHCRATDEQDERERYERAQQTRVDPGILRQPASGAGAQENRL